MITLIIYIYLQSFAQIILFLRKYKTPVKVGFLKSIFKETKLWQNFIIIDNSFSTEEQIYIFHLLKTEKKLRSLLFDIPAIYSQSLKKPYLAYFIVETWYLHKGMASAKILYKLNIKVISGVKGKKWWRHPITISIVLL